MKTREQTIETIVPSVGDLYRRVNEPLHVDEQFWLTVKCGLKIIRNVIIDNQIYS